MIKKFKKMLSLLSAAAVTASACVFTVPANAVTAPLFYSECEDLKLAGDAQITDNVYGGYNTGFSGKGYVWIQGNGSFSFEVDAPEDGMYNLEVRSWQYLDETGRVQSYSVNGNKGTSYLMPHSDTFTDYSMGLIRLNKGTNEIKIQSGDNVGYGYALYDTVTVTKAVMPELNIKPVLSDPNATKETQGLMNYLCDMYGKHIISGQQEIYGNGHTVDQPAGYSGDDLLGYESEFEWINKNFGVYPAIRGFDMMNYNPLYGWDDGTTERIIEWGNERNGIPTVCWHINLPTDFANYEIGEPVDWSAASYKPNSSFSVANATIEGTKEYEYVMLTIEALAEQLLKVQEAGVPIIFRPYHEAEGNPGIGNAWFWWGQEGPEPYKALWKQLYTTLTEEYGLHNLIWEFNSYTYSSSPEWYPSDEWVDMVGFDKYNCIYNRTDGLSDCPNEDAISDTFYNLVNLTDNKKLVAMPENDTVPSLENMLIEKAHWLYFCIWYDNGSDNFLTGKNKNNYDTLKEIYQSDYCITLDELPDWKNYEYKGPEPDIDFIPGDVNGDEKVNVFDSIALKKYIVNSYMIDNALQYPVLAPSPADTNGDGLVEIADLVLLNQWLVGMDVDITYYVAPPETDE